MSDTAMAKRPRIVVDVTEELRVAIRLAAAKADVNPGELVVQILTEALGTELEVVRDYQARGKKRGGGKSEK
jgi:hypothetical protein